MRTIPARAVLFIDGNNWFHGLKKIGVDAYDLDYRKVARQLLKGRSLVEIRFYIGKVTGDRDRIARQRAKVASLEAQGVRVTWGRIQRNLIPPQKNPALKRLRTILAEDGSRIPSDIREQLDELGGMPVPDYVEKKVDVAIAVDVVRMAYEDEYDVAYLLSADADYVTAVREAQRLGKVVFGVKAAGERSDELGNVLRMIPLRREQFESLLLDTA